MQIGIITFHRTNNYGAVLQAYATEEILKKRGHDVKIIDYVPPIIKINFYNVFISKDIFSSVKRIYGYLKYKKLNKFVDCNFNLTSRYSSSEQLKNNPPEFDIYISGSDQIWNPYFTLNGEGKETFSFFLDFVKENKKRISYASSIGKSRVEDEYIKAINPFLKKYQSISVREKSANNILNKIGISSKILPDPTLLLKKNDYFNILSPKKRRVVSYIIHDNQYFANKVNKIIKRKINIPYQELKYCDIGDWLGYIENAEFVVTNSYHGMIFAIIFQRPFLVIPVEGEVEEMNDRIYTLLGELELTNNILTGINQIDKILQTPINWEIVNKKLDDFVKKGIDYLADNGL